MVHHSHSRESSAEHSFINELIDDGIIKDAAVGDHDNNNPERKTLVITDEKEKRLEWKIRWYVYASHFLSAWGDRMWQFGVGLFLVIISPDSLLETAAYGFAIGFSVLLFGTLIGDWIDKVPRLKAARVFLFSGNLSILACSLVLYFVIVYKHEIVAYWPNEGALTLSYVVIILIAIVSHLASIGSTIAVERDWIVEICQGDTNLLAATSATLKGIDLVTNIVAPIATGQIMYFFTESIGALFIGGWNLASLVAEYYLLWKVHELVPRLREKKFKSKNDDDSDGRTKCAACTMSMFSGFIILFDGWKTFTKYTAAWAGIALAFLYMTVLGFDNVTVGYAYTQGINESIMGALMAAGAVVGILGTLIYPRIRRRVGLERTGLVGMLIQIAFLVLCVASVWAPGSTFDPYIWSRNSASATSSDPIKPVDNSSTLLNNTVIKTESYNETDFLFDIYGNVTVYDKNLTNDPDLVPENHPDPDPERPDKDWTSYISIGLLMLGIIGARAGLWITDLTINQLFLESVEDTERGIVLGVQTSLNQVMDMLKFILVIIAPEPELFGILVVISFVFVCGGWAFYVKFSYSARRRPLNFANIVVSRQGYERLS